MDNWAFDAQKTEVFIERWREGGGSERANYQLFLIGLCELLELPKPDPACDDNRDNAYVFERRVIINKSDGSKNNGFIDLYKRGSFVLEAKQSGLDVETSGWDKAMLRAYNQADQYVRALSTDEGRPPFLIVSDVGRNMTLYSEFSRSGATYTPYPDARSHRILLTDLRKPEIQKRLRMVWLDPLNLDPSRISALVTRDIADQLAKLAKSLEGKYPAQDVADFLMRTLFTMFAEDVGLLPERSFIGLLEKLKSNPAIFVPMLENIWESMNRGGFSTVFEKVLLRFNGGLFADCRALPLDRDQIELLIKAAEADWSLVEPAIFGTLLERALDPRERHKLGAHYTPRAYVERLVMPTIIEPLRAEWQETQTAALAYENRGKHAEAVAEVRAFHKHICQIRVLDPACGSGNFLYVALEHMKRLEGEVLGLLSNLGERQNLLALEGLTIDPHQFLGLEINPRAARVAEMVLWIGYLQWHYRTHGRVDPPEPVLRDFKNIENRDALLDYDSCEPQLDDMGKPVTIWDGISMKLSPITGELIPDKTGRKTLYHYHNPRKAVWPEADYIVGNPPFIGKHRIIEALGQGYVDAIRSTWTLPAGVDFVMYWWWEGARLVTEKKTNRAGFITTNSIVQSMSGRVVDSALNEGAVISFAIADHPWVDSADGAAVRISMSVISLDVSEGRILEIESELSAVDDNAKDVRFRKVVGTIGRDFRVGADVTKSLSLRANASIANVGVQLNGQGFVITNDNHDSFIPLVKPYLTGGELTRRSLNRWIIDTHHLTEKEVREQSPVAYQHLLVHVKPERDQNSMKSRRERWWLFGAPAAGMREATRGLKHFIVTCRTGKHRTFSFVIKDTVVESTAVTVASAEAWLLGVLSSRLHIVWANIAGGKMGIGNDPRYQHERTFNPFPFPELTPDQESEIGGLAEQIDALRKRQQTQHEKLSLTNMYNVLEKLRSGESLSVKERVTHEQGLVSVLRELHDALDRAVFAAYGWDDLADKLVGLPGATTPLPDKPESQAEAEEELLTRLVALNAQRAAEEAQGFVRWLRPDYQNPSAAQAGQRGIQSTLDIDGDDDDVATVKTAKTAWPKSMREQVAAVRQALQDTPQSTAQIASQFGSKSKAVIQSVQAVLDALEELGMLHTEDDGRYSLAS